MTAGEPASYHGGNTNGEKNNSLIEVDERKR